MTLPGEFAQLISGYPTANAEEQAFAFITTDRAGFPHVALLSRAELDVTASHCEVLAVVGSRRTTENLKREGRVTVIAIGGTTAHYLKLVVDRTVSDGRLLGCVLRPVEHIADSIGIPLDPIRFRTTTGIAELENWQSSRAMLSRLHREAAKPQD